MSRAKKIIIALLILILLILFGLQQKEKFNRSSPSTLLSSGEPTYQSKEMVTLAYEPTGNLSYKLVAAMVKHYADIKETWFIEPYVTTYDMNAVATWTIRADQAKLTNSRQLYLYGNIKIDNLEENTQLEHILTDSAYIDLTTQNISSDSKVTLLGPAISSVGYKMTGNLRNKTANLIEDVKTRYSPQK